MDIIAFGLRLLDHVQRDEVLVQFGIIDRAEGVGQLLVGKGHEMVLPEGIREQYKPEGVNHRPRRVEKAIPMVLRDQTLRDRMKDHAIVEM